jgi:uncharacterized repeat protein (TIGR03803 family)
MKTCCAWKAASIVFLMCAAFAISSSAQTLTTIYDFCSQSGCPEGGVPWGGLVQGSDGNFYGTTSNQNLAGYGAVYKLTSSGTLTVLHSFTGLSDGGVPLAGLVQASDGNFYGVTTKGGDPHSNCGTVYKVTASGTLTTLHEFAGHPNDGCQPYPALVQASDGNFYGTTYYGGTSNNCGSFGCGTVFKITTGGTETILYSFCTQSGCLDGSSPQAGLVQGSDGNLYGETFYGGPNFGGPDGYGTAFKITLSGTLTTLHNFDFTNGADPSGTLVQASDGNFYGTTSAGGANGVGGTVFKMTSIGTLTTLYNFCPLSNCRDGGAGPNAGLVQASDGNFYGTTAGGGANVSGTIFAITPGGAFSSLYSFCSVGGTNCTDGAYPEAGLIQASDGKLYGVTSEGGNANFAGTAFELQVTFSFALTVSTSGNGSVASRDGFIHCPGTCSHTYPPNTPVTLDATPGQGWVFGGWNGACLGTGSCTVTMTQPLSVDAIFSQAQQFVAATPCRLIDTRLTGGPIPGGTYRSFPIPQEGGCNIPTTAAAYSLNVSVVPQGPLGYLTIWPTDEVRPVVATLNSLDGRIKADAAIVPAGTSGAVSVYVTNTSNVVLDINGYFEPVSGSTLAFYPLTPCRIADTRKTNFPPGLGAPYLPGHQERDFPILAATSCNIPSSGVAAYSLNFSVVPHGGLGYMTVWPTGQTRPLVSTLNDVPGTIIANAAIVPVGTSGDISVYPSNDTDVIIDINGYFAPAGPGGLSLYPAAPCRVIDTRHVGNGQPFSGTLTPPVNVVGSQCEPPVTALAYVFNATVVPTGALGYLTLWPDGDPKPLVSTLNALDGTITNNMAIVPSTNGKVDAFAAGITQLILDISSYFAP